jgi:ATP synthase protein I
VPTVRKFFRLGEDKKLEIVEEKKLKEQKKEEKDRLISMFSLASELGFSISLPLVGGAFLGRYLDDKLHTSPKITLSLIFFGLVLGMMNIYMIIKKESEKN